MSKHQQCIVCKKQTTNGYYVEIHHSGDSSYYSNVEYKHYHDKCVNPTQIISKTGRFDEDGCYYRCDFSRE